MKAAAEERALARAACYRALALAFSYPTEAVTAELRDAFELTRMAGEVLDDRTRATFRDAQSALEGVTQSGLEREYQHVFTLSYSEDCPLYETAFSARHLFQQAQQQADLAGWYHAFGVRGRVERPDHLAVELEFAYLLALKEGRARNLGEKDHIQMSRDASRTFLREHLARWAPLIAHRVAVTGADTWYEAAAVALDAFIAGEEKLLRLGTVPRFRDEPLLIADEPGEMTCPIADEAFAQIVDLPEAWRDNRVSSP